MSKKRKQLLIFLLIGIIALFFFSGEKKKITNISSSITHYPERPKPIHTIHQQFKTTAIQTIQGSPGIGKLALAIEYAYRFTEHYDALWFIEAQTDPLLSLARLADELHIPGYGLGQQRIKKLFNNLAQQKKWLLIYRHPTSEQQLKKILPHTDSGGHILILTDQFIPQSYPITKLSPLSPPESSRFLLSLPKKACLSLGVFPDQLTV
ncbi:hypothetical protein ACQZV8_19785 [Magnetococcales bacterium HHB-1]